MARTPHVLTTGATVGDLFGDPVFWLGFFAGVVFGFVMAVLS